MGHSQVQNGKQEMGGGGRFQLELVLPGAEVAPARLLGPAEATAATSCTWLKEKWVACALFCLWLEPLGTMESACWDWSLRQRWPLRGRSPSMFTMIKSCNSLAAQDQQAGGWQPGGHPRVGRGPRAAPRGLDPRGP